MNEEFGPWRKSSRSDGGQNCVEVADAVSGSAVGVRDSKDPDGGSLRFAGSQWRSFVSRLDTFRA